MQLTCDPAILLQFMPERILTTTLKTRISKVRSHVFLAALISTVKRWKLFQCHQWTDKLSH